MKKLDSLSADASQELSVILDDGSVLQFTFNYRPAAQRWSVDVLYGEFGANGVLLATHPNLLRTWRNILPFGLAITSQDSADPFKLDDFTSGRITLYVLDSTAGGTEVQDVETTYFT